MRVPVGSYPEQWDGETLQTRVSEVFGLSLPVVEWVAEEGIEPEVLAERIKAEADGQVDAKIAEVSVDSWRGIEKSVLLQTLDEHWKDHLSRLDALRQVIHLRAYAQKTPINEYKHEAFAMFERLLETIREDVTRILANVSFDAPPPLPELPDFLTTHLDPFTATDDTRDHRRRGPRLCHDADRADAVAAARYAGVARHRSGGVGRAGQPQRAVPVRIGEEVQALPRGALTKHPPRPSSGRGTAREASGGGDCCRRSPEGEALPPPPSVAVPSPAKAGEDQLIPAPDPSPSPPD